MPAFDWNDLQYVLAVARDGSLAAVARRLKVDPTTVGRRLRAIEAALGAKLFERDSDGQMRATDAGRIVIQRTQTIEAEIGNLDAAVRTHDVAVRGTVRLTAVPVLINRVLMPALPALIARHPELNIELVADHRDLNLPRRDADIAVRLARPGNEAGERIVARRIGMLAYAVYAAANCADPHALPWLTYEAGMRHLPQAQWIARVADSDGGLAAVVANDAEALLQGVQAGLGRSLLPCIVADRTPGLVRLPHDHHAPPEREIWTLTHPDVRPLARISAVLAWLDAIVATPYAMSAAT
ncbi:LysR family transcriptional regulator [Paraburkholderia sp. ZP32-5]|uniref:LysR family transcriptional regulator n=1 Tax=Paraburkholderia sp. ZP32-5 TaxID=2883245 RepID=UPI001F2758EF|nr:LysR family transcriptional regulator [Paraburkholderia sp. ZP32-5]